MGLKEEGIHQCWKGIDSGSLMKPSPLKSMRSDGWHPVVTSMLAGVLARPCPSSLKGHGDQGRAQGMEKVNVVPGVCSLQKDKGGWGK